MVSDILTMDPVFRELQNLQKLCEERQADDSIKLGIDKAVKMIEAKKQYCDQMTSEPSTVLKMISQETNAYPFGEAFKEGKLSSEMYAAMMTGTLEGNFLQSIISMSKAKRVLDIGTFTGYSSLACAEALPKDGKVITCEIDPHMAILARNFHKNSVHGEKVTIRLGHAKDTLLVLASEKEKFDVVFIDANKNGYKEYYQIIMEHDLLAKGGTILFDNAFMFGLAYMNDSCMQQQHGLDIRNCMDYIRTQKNIHTVLVPIRDGVLIVRRLDDTLTTS